VSWSFVVASKRRPFPTSLLMFLDMPTPIAAIYAPWRIRAAACCAYNLASSTTPPPPCSALIKLCCLLISALSSSGRGAALAYHVLRILDREIER
jgi:hypothetical protein